MSRELTATQRANIVFAREQGFSYKKIADQVGCGKSTIRDLFRRLEVTGATSPRKRSGRPNALNEKDKASLKRLAKSDKSRRLTLSQIQEKWNKKNKTSFCEKTIRRALHDLGLRSCIARRKPLVTETHM